MVTSEPYSWTISHCGVPGSGVLTHCNTGALATGGYGTALGVVYAAHASGKAVRVFADETRPLLQGARLTAWELSKHGVPHTLIADNTGGHLMQHGLVDIVIVGTDRTTCTGDVANKIGTYLKALAARDNGVPFYVALPSSTFDWQLRDGLEEIPVEERDPDEIRFVQGSADGILRRVLVPPQSSPAINYAFDVTPARLVSGFITERGICEASQEAVLLKLFRHTGQQRQHVLLLVQLDALIDLAIHVQGLVGDNQQRFRKRHQLGLGMEGIIGLETDPPGH